MERNALDESAKRVMEYKLERKALDKKKNKKCWRGKQNAKQNAGKKNKKCWSLERNALFF